MEIYEVGGCVRDSLLGVPTKDVDFVVVTPGGYDAMRAHLVESGFRIYQERPEFVTIRAGVPQDHPLRARTKDADFVLARKDGPSADGRRPEYVEPGTLLDDLARRDFTVNAMARAVDGTLIDPHGGQADLAARKIRFVGDPLTRIHEDGLRVLRGFRFAITKQFRIEARTLDALQSEFAGEMLRKVSVERISDELEKMFAANTVQTLLMLNDLPRVTLQAIFREGLRLMPTLKGRKQG